MAKATCHPHAWQRVSDSVGVEKLEATKYNANHDSRGRFAGGSSGRASAAGASKVKAKAKKVASRAASRTVELSPTDGKIISSHLYPASIGVTLTPQGKPYEVQSFRARGAGRSETEQLELMHTKVLEWGTSGNGRDLSAAKFIARAAIEERMDYNGWRSSGNRTFTSLPHLDLIVARQKKQLVMDNSISGVIAVSRAYGKLYVDYLATNPASDGTGVGSQLLRAAAIQGTRLGLNGLKLQALSTASSYYHRTMGMTPHSELDGEFTWTRAQMTRFARTGKLPTGVTLKYYEELKLGGDYGRMAKEPIQLSAMELAYLQEPEDGAFVSKREVFSPRQVYAPKRVMLNYARTKALVNPDEEEEDSDYFDELGDEIKYNERRVT